MSDFFFGRTIFCLRSNPYSDMASFMEPEIKYRGRVATAEDVVFINRLIAENPNDSRRALSLKICREWNWVQPNGEPKDMVCRGFMLALHRAGHIRLPPPRHRSNPAIYHQKPKLVEVDDTPIVSTLKQVGPLEFRQVRRSESEPMFNSLIQEHHYLGYTQPVGEHLKFVVFADTRPVACLAWSSAPRHIGCRDRFVGWSADVRKQNIRLIAYNNRFLILPWVRIDHLASHILGRMTRILPEQWHAVYRHPVFLAETFVDTERFAGTCYKAANWIRLGQTTGRGKDDQTKKPNRSIKAVWGYPLVRNFRKHLCGSLENGQQSDTNRLLGRL